MWDPIQLLTQFGAILFGLIVGSFLSVCVYRIPLGRSIAVGPEEEEEEPEPGLENLPDLPRQKLHQGRAISLTYPPRSFCPHCQTQLRWFHNIPVVSWLILRGRCSFCSTRIPARYPLLELLSAFFCWLCVFHFGLGATAVIAYALCAALIVISFIDIDFYIIPNVISLPGTAIGLGVGLLNHFLLFLDPPFAQGFLDSLLGCALGAGFLWLIAEGYFRIQGKIGMGLGDVKLLAFIGAFLGIWGAFYTIFLGSLVGSVVGISMILVRGKKMSHHLPFGPYLAVGAMLYLFSQTALLNSIADTLFPHLR